LNFLKDYFFLPLILLEKENTIQKTHNSKQSGMKKNNWYWWILIGIVLIVTYQTWIKRSNNLEVAINFAGKNSIELEKVIEHYSKIDKDKEKLAAAQFLISNCIIHFSQEKKLKDPQGNPVLYNPLDYANMAAAGSARDSILRVTRVESKMNLDINTLNSNFLIKHIDYSINIWRNCPWKAEINFDQFCNYILPYRGVSEPISFWIEELHQKYKHVVDTISNKTIVNTCKALNAAMANDIKYDNRWVSGGLGTQSIPDILKNKSGMCDDMTAYGACVMRAFGIPTSIDFDIHGRNNYGHSWCVIHDESGKTQSFGPGEDQPGEHVHAIQNKRWKRLAKVFRKSFAINKNGLCFKVQDLNSIPPFFRAQNISDVSNQYMKTFDVEYSLEQALTTNQRYMYICVYNNQMWRPIQWGEIKNDRVIFPDMGADILYIVGYFSGSQIVPISSPFILLPNGTKQFITEEGKINENPLIFKRIASFGVPKGGNEYQLFSWQTNHWNHEQTVMATKDTLLVINDVKENTLYRFQNSARPFTVHDSVYTWW